MRSRRHKLQVSTFPFLAVLLCAMGALLLVLLVMDRRAHDAARARAAQAVRRAAEETSHEAEARRAAIEQAHLDALAARQQERDAENARLESKEAEVQGNILSVQQQMVQAAERLRAEQDAEADLKRKIEVESERAGSEEQALALARAEEKTNAVQSESARKALAQMTADLASLERTLADLKAAREKEKQTYSVIPYNGKRGENRRPLYIECAAGEVIFHPDRTPLAEARLTAEAGAEVERRLARQKEQLPPDRAAAYTPYLMVLVRPDGVTSYYLLRQALHGLKIDFGYEFVDKDWVLDFPAEDQDASPQPWMSSAKPSPAAPPPTTPAADLHHLIGLAPAHESGGPPAGPHPDGGTTNPNPGGGPPGPPGLLPLLSPYGIGNNAGPGGTAGPAAGGVPGGSAPEVAGPPTGPAGHGSGSPTAQGEGPPLPGPADANPGPPAGAPSFPPQPLTPASGSPGAGATPVVRGPAVETLAHSSPPGDSAGQPSPVVAVSPGGKSAATSPLSGAAVSGPKDGAKTEGTAPSGAPSGPTTGDRAAATDSPDDDPFLRTPPAPSLPAGTKTKRPPPALRPARLSGDRDWLIYVECKEEGVVIYPTQLLVPTSALGRPSGSNPLLQSVQQLIDRKQATVRAGENPYRPEVRFLVHPEAGRTYHLAYPTLDALAAPKSAQNLGPDDDVSAIVAAH